MLLNQPFVRGLATGIVYYIVVAAIVWLTSLLFPWAGAHVPGIPMLLSMVALLAAMIWSLLNIISIVGKVNQLHNWGTLAVHMIVLLVLWLNG